MRRGTADRLWWAALGDAGGQRGLMLGDRRYCSALLWVSKGRLIQKKDPDVSMGGGRMRVREAISATAEKATAPL